MSKMVYITSAKRCRSPLERVLLLLIGVIVFIMSALALLGV